MPSFEYPVFYMDSSPHRHKAKKPVLNFLMIAVGSFVAILSTAFLLFAVYAEVALKAYYMPSGSMQPTLKVNDRLIVNKLAYQSQQPQRGDIIVFNPPEILQKQNYNGAFVKRVIGLPGDQIEIKAGKVYINDQVFPEKYIAEPAEYTFGPVTVPAHSYFVLGDNRNNSYDSHYWGFVSGNLIIGKATTILWPPEHSGSL